MRTKKKTRERKILLWIFFYKKKSIILEFCLNSFCRKDITDKVNLRVGEGFISNLCSVFVTTG